MMKFLRVLLFLCTMPAAAHVCAQQAVFKITNRLALEREDELVIVKRDVIEKKLGKNVDSALLVLLCDEKEQPLQFVDANVDGRWDEIVFLSSFQPMQVKTFVLQKHGIHALPAQNYPVQSAHLRMKPLLPDSSFGTSIRYAEMSPPRQPADFTKHRLPPYLTEGPGWENDKVAFRLYFDTRNTIDIYGKRIAGMVMDTIGANPANSYHTLSAWGMDILRVAKSLGAGSLAIDFKDTAGKDTLLRIGGSAVKKETYTQVADGPVLAAFQLEYLLVINGRQASIRQLVSIWGGQYFYQSTVTATGLPAGAQMVNGIADFYENTASHTDTLGISALYSFGRQSENRDELGLALLMQTPHAAHYTEAPKASSDITETHLASRPVYNNRETAYRFYACWRQTNNQFSSPQFFREFIKSEAAKLSSPLTIAWR